MLDHLLAKFSEPGPDYFVVEGRWAVEALLEASKFEVVLVLRAEGSHLDFDEKFANSAEILILPKSRLSELMGFAFHRGLLALAKRPGVEPVRAGELQGVLVACPHLADESNLGAIIRTGAALGVSGILLPWRKGADVFSRKSIRASSGAVFRLPIFECADLMSDIARLKGQGFTVVATYLGQDSIPLHEVPQIGRGIVVFGSENDGISEEWLELCDVQIKIPMANGMDSLNVAASAAIVLYQLLIGSRNSKTVC